MGKLSIFFVFAFLYAWQPNANAEVTESYGPEDSTVQYVTAVFRHGERTVDAGTVYPVDPHINETYYPYGVGQLTSQGKKREYNIGRLLRKRYDPLLGIVYVPDILEPVSTNMNRTKASLTLVLAGLYPPRGSIMEWNTELNWQPIPYNYVDYEKDLWFTVPMYFCPNYAKEYAAYLKSPEGKKMQDKYESLYEYLRDNTGKNIKRTTEVFSLYSCLVSQSEWGLKLPDWTVQVWRDTLSEATKDGLASGVATKKLKQLSGGLLVKRIIDNMKAKSTDTLQPEARKMSLYAGHDLNIAYLLGALNSFTRHEVPYGACVIIELHKISGAYYVKVLYEDYTGKEPNTLTIPGCEKLCPLNKFEEVLKENYPEGSDPCGFDLTVFEEHTQERDYYKGQLNFKTLVKMYVEFAEKTKAQFKKAVFDSVTYMNKTKAALESGVKDVFNKGKEFVDKAPNPFKFKL